MGSQGVDAQRMFATATLMCIVWLGAMTMLIQQAQVSDLRGDQVLTNAQSLALLTYSTQEPAID